MKTTNNLRLAVTLRLLDGEGRRRFGPGVAALLEEVREKRSLRAAAGSMGMAYSKAWRIVRDAEESLGTSSWTPPSGAATAAARC